MYSASIESTHRERVRRLERRDDPLGAREPLEGVERLLVGAGDVLGPARVAQERVLGADAGVVEPGRDRVRVGDLAVLVGEDRRARAVQDAGAAAAERGRPRRLDADQAHSGVVDEPGEHADRVRAAADAGDDRLRQRALRLEQLLARLAADHGLELAHDLGVGRRADARADHVVGRLDVRDPVADRLARRLLQRARAELDGDDRRAHQVHPLDVGRLAAHVLGAHEDDALEPEARAGGRRRDAVLAGSGLGDDPRLAEAPGEHDLPERVVDLVRAGVVEVLALEVELLRRREARRQRDRGGAPGVGAAEVLHLGEVGGVGERLVPRLRQLVERRDQRLGHVAAAVGAVGLFGRRHQRAASTYRLTLS